MVPRKSLLFDFDGVLIDSYDATYKIMHEEEPSLTREGYRKWFSGNAARSLKKRLSLQRIKDFFQKYTKRAQTLPLVPGMREVVTSAAKLYNLVIVSSSSIATIQTFLEHHKLLEYFTEILGYEAGVSKEEKIKQVLHDYYLQSEDCIFVTDTSGDVREAHAVYVAAVAVTWGYHQEAELETRKPEYIVSKPNQILPFVKQHFESHALTRTV